MSQPYDEYDVVTVAGRPWRPEEYDPERLRVWQAGIVDAGFTPPIYSNAVTERCAICGIEILIGPRSQEQVKPLLAAGRAINYICLVDVAPLTQQGNTDVRSLNNPEGNLP